MSILKRLNATQLTGVFLAIFVLVFFARSIYTVAPELGGDALRKWQISIAIAETNDLSLLVQDRHHSARWGINFPLVGIVKAGGDSATNYMLIPMLMYSGIFAMLVLFARHSFTGSALLLLCVLLFYEPMFFRASNNPQPFVFGVFYICISLWALVRFIDNRIFGYLLLSAIFAFLAYGAKETYVFFYPALFLLLLVRTNFKICVIYGAALLFLLFLETLLFNALSPDFTLGRIEYLAEGRHLQSMYKKELFGSYSIRDFLTRRWASLPLYNQIVTTLFTLFFCYLLATRRLFKLDDYVVGVLLLAVSYYAMLTFIPLKLDPLLSVQPLSDKYLTTAMPFVIFAVVYLVNYCTQLLPTARSRQANRGIAIATLVFLAYSVVWESPMTYRFHEIYPTKNAFIWKQREYIASMEESLEQGYAICVLRWRNRSTVFYWFLDYLELPKNFEQNDTSRFGKIRAKHIKNFTPANISQFDKARAIHLKKFESDKIIGFIPDDEIRKILAVDECDHIQIL